MPMCPSATPNLTSLGVKTDEESAVRQLLVGLGEDPSREGLHDTPKRVAKALLDASTGYLQQPKDVLGTAYFNEPIVKNGGEGVVIVRDIDFASTSVETLLPFHGRCHIGYVPSQGRVLGLSKLARLTKLFAKRLQTQEQLGWQLTAALHRHLQCQGVAVVLHARHLSMATTGAQPAQRTTACVSGCFTDRSSCAFEELLLMLGVDSITFSDADQLPLWAQTGAAGSAEEQQLSRHEQHQLGQHSYCVNSTAYPSHVDAPSPPPTPDLSEKEDVTSFMSLMSDMGERFSERSTSGKDVSDLCSGSVSDPESESDCEQSETHLCNPHPIHSSTQPPTVLHLEPAQAVACHGVRCLSSHDTLQPMLPVKLQQQGAQPIQQLQPEQGRAKVKEDMQQAVVQLICSMAPCQQLQQEAADSAKQYVSTLLHATSGYSRQLPAPIYQPNNSVLGPQAAMDKHTQATVYTHAACPHCQGSGMVGSNAGADELMQMVAHSSIQHAGVELRHVKVAFNSQCEHHMLPFYGHVHVVFTLLADHDATPSEALQESVPSVALEQGSSGVLSGGVQPASTVEAAAIREVVSMYTQRLQVQERITHQVADGVWRVLGGAASSVLVLADAAHMCMVARGVENHAGHTTSVAVRGAAVSDVAWRKRALAACQSASLS